MRRDAPSSKHTGRAPRNAIVSIVVPFCGFVSEQGRCQTAGLMLCITSEVAGPTTAVRTVTVKSVRRRRSARRRRTRDLRQIQAYARAQIPVPVPRSCCPDDAYQQRNRSCVRASCCCFHPSRRGRRRNSRTARSRRAGIENRRLERADCPSARGYGEQMIAHDGEAACAGRRCSSETIEGAR
jgi:hypothetical protein